MTQETEKHTYNPDIQLGHALQAGFARLPHMSPPGNEQFKSDFPFSIDPINGLKKLFTKGKEYPILPTTLTPFLDPVQQNTPSDCVGAIVASTIASVTNIPFTRAMYQEFLQLALTHGLAVEDANGIKVNPRALNVLATVDMQAVLPNSEITVAHKKQLSLGELTYIATKTQEKSNPSYKLFILLPISSETFANSGHFVALQAIEPSDSETKVTIYDPKIGQQAVFSEDEFNRRWAYTGTKEGIFVFVKGEK